MNQFRLRSKVWLEVDGHSFLGYGRYQLLTAIQRHGSINAAARDLGLSYRKVWSQLQAMEKVAPFPLMERRVGGRNGGATHLTVAMLKLMNQYEAVYARLNSETDRCFCECFGPDSIDGNE